MLNTLISGRTQTVICALHADDGRRTPVPAQAPNLSTQKRGSSTATKTALVALQRAQDRAGGADACKQGSSKGSFDSKKAWYHCKGLRAELAGLITYGPRQQCSTELEKVELLQLRPELEEL